MSVPDNDRSHDDRGEQSTISPVRRRSRQIALGAVGLAAVLGVGTYLVTDGRTGHGGSATDTGATAPLADVSVPPSARSASTGTAMKPPSAASSAGTAKPWASMSAQEKEEVNKRIRAAHEAMAKDGVKLTRPLEPKPRPGASGEAFTSIKGSLNKGGITRVTTARYDLTGQKDLLWAADGGKRFGEARCTQKFRFSRDKPVRELPTMLMCWRTSAVRSVVAVTVEKEGRPSIESNLAILAREWAKLK